MAEIRYNGKKPLAAKAQKTASSRINLADLFSDTLGLDPEIKKGLDAKGLSYRWISAPKLQEFNGHHARGWRPVKLKECGTLPSNPQEWMFGSDPEGYIRRGDCILAVRPKELNEKHKAYLKQEADERTRAVSNKAHADELRHLAKEAGVEIKLHEGFEENE